MSETKNKNNKKHRDEQKKQKRLKQLAKFSKHVPKKTDKSIVYDPAKKRLDAMKKANPLASLVTGIQDTVKVFKKKKT
jgi:hypothetical protein